MGLGVLVASRWKPSAAHYCVRGPSEVEQVLQRIAELPSSSSDGSDGGSGSGNNSDSGGDSGDTYNGSMESLHGSGRCGSVAM